MGSLKQEVEKVQSDSLTALTLFTPGGGFRSPQVRKSDRLLSKCISNVTKLLDFSYNTYPELLVPFLAIFFWLGACQGAWRGGS